MPFLLFLAVSFPACEKVDQPAAEGATVSVAPDPCAVTSSPAPAGPAPGSTDEDREIARLQEEFRTRGDTGRALERLGWAYVAKARVSYDPGYYKLAEQTALCMDRRRPGAHDALLLRGHVLHNLHRFEEGEALARELVTERGSPYDYGLLGDLLMEQGKLEEALPAYQKMNDLKPGLQAYSRAAHMRWLKGDLPGAIELMRMAAQSGSPRMGEPVSWAYSRLAMYELQAGNTAKALEACDAGLGVSPGYAPALLARGHVLLAEGEAEEALEPLRKAADENPLPEYQWALAEALRALGRLEEAVAVEGRLMQRGALEDPRTFALYLATAGKEPARAVSLAREELGRRSDVHTLDVLAWSLAAEGRVEEARRRIADALSEGTQDARLFLHAGVIAVMAGREDEARSWLDRAAAIRQMLLPSERELLRERRAQL